MDLLGFIGGLSFFLFGMNVMETGLRDISGDKIKDIMIKISESKFKGIVFGTIITAIVQSSSAVTVSLIGLCEAELISFTQSVPIIMGANIGTSVTAWIILLSGKSFWLKPSALCPVSGLIGVFFIILCKNNKRLGSGMIMIGFSLLMSGIESMSSATENFTNLNLFRNIISVLNNPFIGIGIGIIMTAVIQSSSASVGILQSLSVTGALSIYNAVPVILGQNIGTCITAVLACISGSKESKKICGFHILFNIAGSFIWFTVLLIINNFVSLNYPISSTGIAMVHTVFNMSTTILFTFIPLNPNSDFA